MQVSLGSQRHTTRAAKPVDGRAVFDQRLAFIATLPLMNATLRMVLLTTDSVKNQGKKLAHAFIPVSSLLPPWTQVLPCAASSCQPCSGSER